MLAEDAVFKGVEAGKQARMHWTGGRRHREEALVEAIVTGQEVETGSQDLWVGPSHAIQSQAIYRDEQQVHRRFPSSIWDWFQNFHQVNDDKTGLPSDIPITWI